MTGYSKHIKGLIREYATEAYERELYWEPDQSAHYEPVSSTVRRKFL
jgi:hypothetical protein